MTIGSMPLVFSAWPLLAPGIFQTPRSPGLDPKMADPALES